MKKRHKFLIGLVGLVGSGKTHAAKFFVKELGAVHIRTDAIRVQLRKQGKTYDAAPRIARKQWENALARGRSVIADFDAIRPERQKELRNTAGRFQAKPIFVEIKTPQSLILKRLQRHSYSKNDIFRNAGEAIRIYFIRRKLHRRPLRPKPDFVINNARPLEPQLAKVIKKLKG